MRDIPTKGRRLLDGTLRDFAPDVLSTMRHAFNLSWRQLDDRFRTQASVDAARVTLANIIVGLAEHGITDMSEMALQATDLFSIAERDSRP
jgi:hypothetical protein